jgi:hypothetical protein
MFYNSSFTQRHGFFDEYWAAGAPAGQSMRELYVDTALDGIV